MATGLFSNGLLRFSNGLHHERERLLAGRLEMSVGISRGPLKSQNGKPSNVRVSRVPRTRDELYDSERPFALFCLASDEKRIYYLWYITDESKYFDGRRLYTHTHIYIIIVSR